MKKNAKHLKPILNLTGFVLLGLLLTLTTKTSVLAVMAQIDAGGYNTVGLNSDGTAMAVGDNKYRQCDVDDWTDIVQVTVGAGHTVGLKSDGTVMAVGYNAQGQCDVDSWSDIVQVSAGASGGRHTVGLKSDGTAVAVGYNAAGQCDVGDFIDIVQVAAGGSHTVGLTSDGTVVVVGSCGYGRCDVESWTDIVQVSAGFALTVGLKSDGTVVAAGCGGIEDYGQCDVDDWTDIVQVAAYGRHTIGLKSDGTVRAAGLCMAGQCDVDSWTDVIQVSAGWIHTVGLKSNGTVITAGCGGWNYGQCDVSDWKLIVTDNSLVYTPVMPCRIVDTRKSGGMIGASTERDFQLFGDSSTISAQGGNSAGCPAPSGEPFAAHINLVAVSPTGKGNLQAFPVGAGAGAGLSVNYNTIDTNLANAGSVKAVTGPGPDITVASNFSSAHTVIDILGYYYPDDGFLYAPVAPCRIVDTRKTSAGIIEAYAQRDFRVYGPSETISTQGGNPTGCPSPLGEPLAAHLNMIAVNPTGEGNLQAFPVGAGTGAGLSVNYNTIDTNLANAGTVKTVTGVGTDITVASNFSSAHTAIDVLGYYYLDDGFSYSPVAPCRIVDTRKTTAGKISTSTQRDFHVYGTGGTLTAQGGNSAGCPAPMGDPLAAHINMIAVNPTGKGNLQAFPVGASTGAGLSVNYNTIDTNLANAGTVKTISGTGPDITVASNFSSAHTIIDVLGYYYPSP